MFAFDEIYPSFLVQKRVLRRFVKAKFYLVWILKKIALLLVLTCRKCQYCLIWTLKNVCIIRQQLSQLFKRQPHKMVKHTQTIHRQKPTNCLSMFDNFVGLPFKGLNWYKTLMKSVFLSSNYLKMSVNIEYEFWKGL